MNESTPLHVPYEEVIHAIAKDAHAWWPESRDILSDNPDHLDTPGLMPD